MPFDTPFNLGPFLVDTVGRLSPRSVEASPGFTVRWRGRSVRARLEQISDGNGRLTLQAVVGRVPSTAAGTDTAAGRPRSFDALRGLRKGIPKGWRLRLLPDHSAVVETEPGVSLPVTAIDLVTELTRFLLRLAPYLDVLDSSGMAVASRARPS